MEGESLDKCETLSRFKELDFCRSIRHCRKQVLKKWHKCQSDKEATIVIKGLRRKSKFYKMISNTVTGDASIGMVKKPKSILKKLATEKFKESLDFVEVKEKKKSSNRKKHPAQDSIAKETDGSCDVLIVSMKDGHLNDWFLDSCCSYHMCPKKGWFCTCKDYNEGTVPNEK